MLSLSLVVLRQPRVQPSQAQFLPAHYASICLGGEGLNLVGRQVSAEVVSVIVRRQATDLVRVILGHETESILLGLEDCEFARFKGCVRLHRRHRCTSLLRRPQDRQAATYEDESLDSQATSEDV